MRTHADIASELTDIARAIPVDDDGGALDLVVRRFDAADDVRKLGRSVTAATHEAASLRDKAAAGPTP